MTPDQHAARAVDMADKAASADGPWTSEQRVRMGLEAITHAVLSLRCPAPEPLIVSPGPVITLPGEGLGVGDGRDVPVPNLIGGVWVTRYYDGSSWAVHRDELSARRAADDGQTGCGDVVAFLPFGTPIGDLQ